MNGWRRGTLLLAAVLVLTDSAAALEKTARRLDDNLLDDWGANNTVTLGYYNNCTGWVWVWSGWSPGEQMGVCYELPCNQPWPCSGRLDAARVLTFSPAPSGYGFTGTVTVEDDCTCSGQVLASQPFLPATSGWNTFTLPSFTDESFLIRYTWGAANVSNPTGIASDHPFRGPTGPTACDLCFPADRPVGSLYFGVGGSICPGQTLSDGLCDVEFMHEISLKGYLPVEDVSWGQVKDLYR